MVKTVILQINVTLGRIFNLARACLLQEESTDAIEMTPEEVQEQIDFEDSAEFLPYAEDSDY